MKSDGSSEIYPKTAVVAQIDDIKGLITATVAGWVEELVDGKLIRRPARCRINYKDQWSAIEVLEEKCELL